MMLFDLEELPNKANWASMVRSLLINLVFYEVWFKKYKRRSPDNDFHVKK